MAIKNRYVTNKYISNRTKRGSIKKMRVPCLISTSDRVGLIYLDAAEWLERQQPQTIVQLFKEGLGSDSGTLATIMRYNHPGVKVIKDYLYAVAPFKSVSYECWMSTKRATAWLKENRTALYTLLLQDEDTKTLIENGKEHVQFAILLG